VSLRNVLIGSSLLIYYSKRRTDNISYETITLCAHVYCKIQ